VVSEHTINGQHLDMEIHLVHQSAAGDYAVVGVMMERGGENPAYTPVWDHMPAVEGEPETIRGVTVNAADLLPAEQSYYRYAGSFTTPPCTEGVKWLVMTTPVELSDAQIDAFEAIYDYNYRPVQPLNQRTFVDSYYIGGIVVPVDKLGLMAPWMGLAALASLAALGVVVVKRRRSA